MATSLKSGAHDIVTKNHKTVHELVEEACKRPVVIDMKDLKQLSEAVGLMQGKDERSERQRREKELLHQISKDKTSQWNNTFAGQRRQKIIARQRYKEEQEKDRLQDVQTAEREAAERRKIIIEKAQQMIYWRDERVGKLHSKVILDRVLHERQLQVEYKKQQAAIIEKHELEADKVKPMNYIYEAEKTRNERSEKLLRTTKDEQFQQFQEKIREKARIKEEKMKEGHVIIQKDKEYQEKQAMRELEKKKEQLKIRDALDESMKYAEQNREEEKRKQHEEEEMYKKWHRQKVKQDEVRKQKEEEYKKEKYNVAAKIATEQWEKYRAKEHQLNNWEAKYVAESEERFRQQREAEKARKIKEREEMAALMRKLQKEKEEEKERRKAENERVKQEMFTLREEVAKEKADKLREQRRKELALQEFRKHQTEEREMQKKIEDEEKAVFEMQQKRDDSEKELRYAKYAYELLAEAEQKEIPHFPMSHYLKDTWVRDYFNAMPSMMNFRASAKKKVVEEVQIPVARSSRPATSGSK